MQGTRRIFLKTTGLACGAATLPSWVFEAQSAGTTALDKNQLADTAISRARKLGVTYADIRINRYRNESILTREERVQSVTRTQSFGFGVRVLFKGAWGFAASNLVTPESVRRVTGQAVEIARANARYQRKPVEMTPAPGIKATWKSAYEKDPFGVSIDDKIQFLLRLNESAMKAKGASFVNSALTFQNEQKFYASTDGSRIEQYIMLRQLEGAQKTEILSRAASALGYYCQKCGETEAVCGEPKRFGVGACAGIISPLSHVRHAPAGPSH